MICEYLWDKFAKLIGWSVGRVTEESARVPANYPFPREVVFHQVTSSSESTIIEDDVHLKALSVNLGNPEESIKKMHKADEIIAPKELHIIVNFPLSIETEVRLLSPKPNGWTRGQLAHEVAKQYYRIYDEEDQDSTDVAYGVWGYSLNELNLRSMRLEEIYNGMPTYSLDVTTT